MAVGLYRSCFLIVCTRLRRKLARTGWNPIAPPECWQKSSSLDSTECMPRLVLAHTSRAAEGHGTMLPCRLPHGCFSGLGAFVLFYCAAVMTDTHDIASQRSTTINCAKSTRSSASRSLFTCNHQARALFGSLGLQPVSFSARVRPTPACLGSSKVQLLLHTSALL